MYYYDRIRQLVELSSYDADQRYEVDMGGIYWDPAARKFLWIAANGCSCWEGEYDENPYDKLSTLLVKERRSDSDWTCSQQNFERMAEEAIVKAIELGLITVDRTVRLEEGQ